MTKTVSTRIDDKVHEEILTRCNREGCTVAYFLEAAIQLALTGSTEFNFGEAEDVIAESGDVSRNTVRTN